MSLFIIRSNAALHKILEDNPFLQDGNASPEKLHVTFLSDIPEEKNVKSLEERNFLPDEFRIMGREIFLHCPNGYGRTKLNNTFFESRLHVTATTRNWRTVQKLAGTGETS